jgi:hypothetical protein
LKESLKLSIILLVFMTGCASGNAHEDLVETNDRGTEVPLSASSQVVPESTRVLGEDWIAGRLLLLQDGESIPVTQAIIYLAEILPDDQGELRLAAMDRVNSPRSVTDEKGSFLFEDVPPGNYGLVLDMIRQSYLLGDPESGEALIITLEEGEAVDMGDLVYDDLPVDLD